MTPRCALAAAILALPVPAVAQDGRGQVDQITASEKRQVTEQISREPANPAQRSSARRATTAATQLTPRTSSKRGPVQLSTGRASAEASAPLSTPAQGRTAAVTRVEGRDRCDLPEAGIDAACQDILERRADDFARRDPSPLTPEQRLLVEQRTRQARMNSQSGAAQRLADEGDAENRAGQGIASMVLVPQAPDRGRSQREEDPGGLADIADAIISGVLTLPSAPPQ